MKKIIYIFMLMATLSSCSDMFNEGYLEVAPEEDINFEKVFGDYTMFRQYADYNYSYVIGHYSHLFNAMSEGMSDLAINGKLEACTFTIRTGAWNGSIPSGNQGNIAKETIYPWADSYKGIRTINIILENIEKVPNFPSQVIKNRYLGEMHFLRGMLYFQLIKRYGGVPLIDRSLALGTDDIDLPRNTYDDCVEFIVKDCDRAAGLLGLKYDDADNGRATIGAALALKSRVLLYAARPLNNTSNDARKWERARDAAKAVIDMNQYRLYPDYTNLFFQPVCEEIILNRPRRALTFEQGNIDGGHFYVRFIGTSGYGGWMGTTPTQNLVDMFEADNGYPINNLKSGYDEQNPYTARDPRLQMIVLTEDRYWYNRKMEFWIDVLEDGTQTNKIGLDKKSNVGCYAVAKLWPENHQRYKGTKTYLNYIYFRYAEILLNFAEAQNEVGGSESNHGGLSVRSAINQIRQRVSHVDVPQDVSDTKEKMRERIWNERGIELSFEDHRWYDVLTWKKGIEYFNKPFESFDILRYPNKRKVYKRIVISESIFKEHMHRYPIPQSELNKSRILEQNPGWERGEE